ncbi:MAG: AraC family transcriptional regulator [Dehalococcoidales bacterium]|nr:AraC family transcriptional regulator [Dehalococcoidales bacterium]
MEWSERLNSAIDYIETHLTGDIDVNVAAKKALCSSFHFQRMFYVVIGITLGEYIRRRRLTLAATELSSGENKVIDVALKYGYESPEAFTRAFRQVHGLTPQAARAPGASLVAYPRVSFHISIKGGIDMDYKIIEKPAFDAVGKSKGFTTVIEDSFIKIPQFWDEFFQTKQAEILYRLSEAKPGHITGGKTLGICFGYHGMEDYRYAIAVENNANKAPAGFEVIHIPAGTWAVFDLTLKETGKIHKRIWEEWFPSTAYEQAVPIDIEVYFTAGPIDPDDHYQIWVPVKKKKS